MKIKTIHERNSVALVIINKPENGVFLQSGHSIICVTITKYFKGVV